MASLTFPIPAGEMTVTEMCPAADYAGGETAVFWRWGTMRWHGVVMTQSRRGAAVMEQPVTGTYYYRMGVYTESVH